MPRGRVVPRQHQTTPDKDTPAPHYPEGNEGYCKCGLWQCPEMTARFQATTTPDKDTDQ